MKIDIKKVKKEIRAIIEQRGEPWLISGVPSIKGYLKQAKSYGAFLNRITEAMTLTFEPEKSN